MLENKIKFVFIQNPVQPENRTVKVVDYDPDKSLADYIGNVPFLRGVTPVAAVNGQPVNSPWDTVYPDEGSIVSISAKMEAGYAAAAVWTALKSTSVIAAAMAAAVTYVAVTVAIGFGINMLASAITGGYETPEADGNSSNSPTYSWGPLRPTEAEGHPIPVIYGEHKVAGQVINKFITVTNESGEQEKSKEFLNILLSVGEGPVDDITDIRINEQPWTNFKDVQVYERLGTLNDEIIPNFNKIVHQQNLSFMLSQGETSTVETLGDNIDSLEVVISAPYGIYYANDKGGLDTRTAEAEVYYRAIDDEGNPLTSWTLIGTASFEAASTEKLQIVKSVSDLPPNKYEVYVTKTTADSDDDHREERTIQWSVLKESIAEDLSYPGIAKYGIKALATDQLSGSQPSMSCIVKKLNLPITNPYTGTTETKSATNPAWATYHFLNVHHGIAAQKLLYEEFEEWATHCDALEAETESKFGIVLDAQATIWENAQRIARIGRASIVRRGTKIGVFIDKPEDVDIAPAHMFTMGNILKETFSYQYLPFKDRANVVELTYVDPDRGFSNQIVSAFLEDFKTSDQLPKKTNIKYNAAISRDRALQEAVYLLKSNRYLIRTVEFEADIDSFACTVGDLVYFQHEIPHYKESYGGRIVHASSSYVELDIDVFVEAGTAYVILVRLLDGSIEEHDVETISESKYDNEFNLLTSFDSTPDAGDLFLFGVKSKAKKLYRIINISRAQDNTRKISCLEYVPDIYEPGGFVVPENPPVYDQLAVGVTAKEFLSYANDGSYESNVAVSWYPAIDNTSSNWAVWLVDITYQEEDNTSGAVKVGETTNTSMHIGNTFLSIQNEYKIYVTKLDSGPTDTGDNTAVVQILGKMALPADVSSFTATYDPSLRDVLFAWNEVSDIDLSHYQIRRVSSEVPADEQTWENAEIRLSEIIGFSAAESIPEDGEEGEFLYMIKAVDTSGNESENADIDTAQIDLSGIGDFLPQVEGLEVTSYCEGKIATMTATWNTQAENHPYFSHYKIEKRDYVNDPIYSTSFFETDENTFTWESISTNETYGIRVRALSVASTAMLKGPWSLEVQHITCSDSEPPDTPDITKLIPGYKVMGIHWNEGDWPDTNEAADIDYYELRRRVEGGDWINIGNKKGTFTTDNELEVEQTYCYSVRATDKSGNTSEWSEEACATTLKVGWEDLALDSLTAEYISVGYLSALAADMGVLITGYIVSETFLENGWEIDGPELKYTGPDADWDDVKHTWDGMYIDTNHPMIYMGTSETDHYVLLEPGRCEFYGIVNFWNSPEDYTQIDGGQIHATSSITIGAVQGENLLDYCYIDDGDIEFYRWFPSIGEHRKVKSLKKIDFGEAKHGENKVLNGYWATKPRIQVWPKRFQSFVSAFAGNSQEMSCEVESINYNSATGECSFTPWITVQLSGGEDVTVGTITINSQSNMSEPTVETIQDPDYPDYYHDYYTWKTTTALIPPDINSIELQYKSDGGHYSKLEIVDCDTEMWVTYRTEDAHYYLVVDGAEYEIDGGLGYHLLEWDLPPSTQNEVYLKVVDKDISYSHLDYPDEWYNDGPPNLYFQGYDPLGGGLTGESEISNGEVYYIALEGAEEEE